MNFDISIVIPCCHHDPLILDVLKSLETQKDCSFEVLLVMNPPPSKKLNVKYSYDLTEIESARGANCARNAGLRQARSDLVMFLDSDCLVEDPYLLKKYVQHMNLHLELTGCGGPYQTPQDSGAVSQAYQNLQMEWLYSGVIDNDLNTQYLLGGNLVIRKSKLKGSEFDEKIIFGGTELELILRLVKEKHIFQLLELQKVTHVTHLSIFNLCKKAFKQGQGQLYTKKKLNLMSRSSQKLLIKKNPNPDSDTTALVCYSLFFELGNRTWLVRLLKRIVTIPVSLYHRAYFYLNLVKRLK